MKTEDLEFLELEPESGISGWIPWNQKPKGKICKNCIDLTLITQTITLFDTCSI